MTEGTFKRPFRAAPWERWSMLGVHSAVLTTSGYTVKHKNTWLSINDVDVISQGQ